MNHQELREIIVRIVDTLRQSNSAATDPPQAGCVFGDDAEPCDTVTTLYAVGEEG